MIEFDDKALLFQSLLRRNCNRALDHGLLVGLVASPTANLLVYAGLVSRLDPHEERVKSLPGQWEFLAEWFRRHSPGPSKDSTNPRILGPKHGLSADKLLLIQRAFHEFNMIRLEKLPGGYTDASVFYVSVSHGKTGVRSRAMPFVVKVDSLTRIKQEQENYENNVEGCVPFSHRPNFHKELYLRGSKSALLVQDFVGSARPLQDLIDTSVARTALDSLFDSALTGFRGTPHYRPECVATGLSGLGVVPWSKGGLKKAESLARRTFKTRRSAKEVRLALDALPWAMHATCMVHGDLHAANVLVLDGSRQAVLIDFFRTSSAGPAVADPACLEISLTFPFGNGPGPATQLLKRLYHPNLVIPRATALGERSRRVVTLVARIRAFARRLDKTVTDRLSDPYRVALACYLLRFATYPRNKPVHRRALAYCLAERLLA